MCLKGTQRVREGDDLRRVKITRVETHQSTSVAHTIFRSQGSSVVIMCEITCFRHESVKVRE